MERICFLSGCVVFLQSMACGPGEGPPERDRAALEPCGEPWRGLVMDPGGGDQGEGAVVALDDFDPPPMPWDWEPPWCDATDLAQRPSLGLDPWIETRGEGPHGWTYATGEESWNLPGLAVLGRGQGRAQVGATPDRLRALSVSASNAEIVLARQFLLTHALGRPVGPAATMQLLAEVMVEPGSVPDGWLAIGMRPLARPDDDGWNDPTWDGADPGDEPDVVWAQVSPGDEGLGRTGGDGFIRAIDPRLDGEVGDGRWYRLTLDFAPPVHEWVAVYLKIGSPPSHLPEWVETRDDLEQFWRERAMNVRVDSVRMALNDVAPLEACDPQEQNDTLLDVLESGAAPLSPQGDDEQPALRGSLCGPADHDWFSVDPGSGGAIVTVRFPIVDTGTGESWPCDVDLDLYNEEGTLLGYAYGYRADPSATAAGWDYAALELAASPSHRYFVRVRTYPDPPAEYEVHVRDLAGWSP